MAQPINNNSAIGHKKISDYFNAVIANDNLAHAYIFYGPRHVGKSTLVNSLINNIICHEKCSIDLHNPFGHGYSDFYYLEPLEGKKDISVEQVRDLKQSLSLSSLLDNYKIAAIQEAHAMNAAAQNALLKLLEEPTKKTILFLLTDSFTSLLPTVRSRAVSISCKPTTDMLLEKELIAAGFAQADVGRVLPYCTGLPGVALRLLRDRQSFDTIEEEYAGIWEMLDAPIHERIRYIQALETDQISETVRRLQYILRNQMADFPGRSLAALDQLHGFAAASRYNINPKLFLENIVINL